MNGVLIRVSLAMQTGFTLVVVFGLPMLMLEVFVSKWGNYIDEALLGWTEEMRGKIVSVFIDGELIKLGDGNWLDILNGFSKFHMRYNIS